MKKFDYWYAILILILAVIGIGINIYFSFITKGSIEVVPVWLTIYMLCFFALAGAYIVTKTIKDLLPSKGPREEKMRDQKVICNNCKAICTYDGHFLKGKKLVAKYICRKCETLNSYVYTLQNVMIKTKDQNKTENMH